MNSWRNANPSGLGTSGMVSLKLARDQTQVRSVSRNPAPDAGMALACKSQVALPSSAHSMSTGLPSPRSTRLARAASSRAS